jgi:hypothetical protein
VEVQVLGILIPTKVRQDAARAILASDLVCNPPYYRQRLVQKDLVGRPEVDERWDVSLWDNNDVHWPERACVAKSKDFVRFRNDFDGRAATQRLVAIEVFAHARPVRQTLAVSRAA